MTPMVKRLPVVGHDGVLKGIVSRSDLLKVFLRDDEDIAEEVRREVVEPLFGTHAEALRVEVRDGVVTLSGLVHDTALASRSPPCWCGASRAWWTCSAR